MSSKQHDAGQTGEERVKRNIVTSPAKEDVHEQREEDQPAEGVVQTPDGTVPRTSTGPTRPPQK
jgi:hypothetical protein